MFPLHVSCVPSICVMYSACHELLSLFFSFSKTRVLEVCCDFVDKWKFAVICRRNQPLDGMLSKVISRGTPLDISPITSHRLWQRLLGTVEMLVRLQYVVPLPMVLC
jgi:hypothetical protein